MESLEQALISAIDIASIGNDALAQIEDLLLRIYNQGGVPSQSHPLYLQAVRTCATARQDIRRERHEVENQLNEASAAAGSSLPA